MSSMARESLPYARENDRIVQVWKRSGKSVVHNGKRSVVVGSSDSRQQKHMKMTETPRLGNRKARNGKREGVKSLTRRKRDRHAPLAPGLVTRRARQTTGRGTVTRTRRTTKSEQVPGGEFNSGDKCGAHERGRGAE
jgi:hypothetical protein